MTTRHEFTVDDLERILFACLEAKDFEGVYRCLVLMAPLDPDRAEEIRQTLLLGLDLAKREAGR